MTGYERRNGWTGGQAGRRTDGRTWWRYHRFSKVLLNPEGFNQKVKNKIEEIRSLFFLSNHACFHLFLRDVVVVFGYGRWFSNLCHQQDPTPTTTPTLRRSSFNRNANNIISMGFSSGCWLSDIEIFVAIVLVFEISINLIVLLIIIYINEVTLTASEKYQIQS